MPYRIKTTFAFAGLEQGWSEDFYWEQSTDDLNAAEALVTPLAQKRAKLLASVYMLTVVRNAIVQSNTGLDVKRTTDIFEPRLPGVASWDPSSPNLALMLNWQTGNNLQNKKQYMRGIPAGIGDAGKVPDLTFGAFLSNFNAWRSALVTFQAGWLSTSPSQTAVINSYTIDEASGIVTFALQAPGLTFANGVGFQQKVYVKLPGKSPLDGSLNVIPASALSVTTADPIGVHPFIPGQLGTMQIRSSTLRTLAAVGAQGNVGTIHPQRIVTHKTGSPSYASRGRSPARPKW